MRHATRNGFEYGEVSPEIFAKFMRIVGGHKHVPIGICRLVLEKHIFPDPMFSFPNNVGLIGIVKTFRSYARENGVFDNSENPTAAFDVGSKEELIGLIKEISNIFSTPDLDEAIKRDIMSRMETVIDFHNFYGV